MYPHVGDVLRFVGAIGGLFLIFFIPLTVHVITTGYDGRFTSLCRSTKFVDLHKEAMTSRDLDICDLYDCEKSNDEIKKHVVRAQHLRLQKQFRNAIKELETAIELDELCYRLWSISALLHYEQWEYCVCNQHLSPCISYILDGSQPYKPPFGTTQLLQDAYSALIVAMEFPEIKKHPLMLLRMISIYMEFGSFRSALTVCTLLVESYLSFAYLNEAIFLSAVVAKELGKHVESAKYFQFLVDKPPYRLRAYVPLLLAAMEYDRDIEYREHARECYTQAYKLMVTATPLTQSEKTAHYIYRTSRKNENYRVQQWYTDNQTWFDLANKMISVNQPVLVISALEIPRQRNSSFPLETLSIEAVAQLRLNHLQEGESLLVQALQISYYFYPTRYLLCSTHDKWTYQFVYEDKEAQKLQCFFRSIVQRKKWRRTTFQLRQKYKNQTAMAIQSWWRMVLAKIMSNELKLARRKRKEGENLEMELHDILLINGRINHAATIIQSLYLIFTAKKELCLRRTLRTRHSHLLSDIAFKRESKRKKRFFELLKCFTAINKTEKNAAAAVIQAHVRSILSKRMFEKLLRVQKTQERLISLCLVKQSKNTKRICFLAWTNNTQTTKQVKDKAAIRIQSFWRGYVDKKRYFAALRRKLHVEDHMKRFIAKLDVNKLLSCLKALASWAFQRRLIKTRSATMIQKVVRGMLARKRAKRICSRNQRNEKLVEVSLRKRQFQMKEHLFEAFQLHIQLKQIEKQVCATTIQIYYRGYRSKRVLRRAIEMEQILKSGHTSLRNKPNDYILRVSFLLIVQHQLYSRKERCEASKKIKKWMVQCIRKQRMARCRRKLLKRKEVALMFQRNFRIIARLFFAQIKDDVKVQRQLHRTAVVIIQCAVRGWLARLKYLRVISAHHYRKDILLQYAKRQQLAILKVLFTSWHCNTLFRVNERNRAVILIQRKYRSLISQRAARRLLAKKVAQVRMLQEVSSLPLLKYFRDWETIVIQKHLAAVRGLNKSSFYEALNPSLSCSISHSRTIEERANVPSIVYYTVLNRVRKSGVCQLSGSYGYTFDRLQLHRLLSLCTSLICDGLMNAEVNQVMIDTIEANHQYPLQKIILYNCALNTKDFFQLSKVVKNPSHHLVSIVLGATHLTSAAATALACAISYPSCRLQQLVLEKCDIGNAGATALAEGLSKNKTIWKLDLSNNHISDVGCKALSDMIISNRTLRVICLSGNEISDRGVISYLAPSIQASGSFSSLEQVALRHSKRITSMGKNALDVAVEVFNTTRPSFVQAQLQIVTQ